jgi:hypothetical protein
VLFAFFATVLWNYAIVGIFGLANITVLKMLALMILIRIMLPLRVNINNNNG